MEQFATRRTNLLLSFVCLISSLATTWSTVIIFRSASSNRQTSTTLLPLLQESQSFEREVLSARIAFIYHVTIRKPGALAAGWKQYGQAETSLANLQTRVGTIPASTLLEPRLEALNSAWVAYDRRLRYTLDMVQAGIHEGPTYDRSIADWAADGNTLVNAARDFANSAAALSQAQSDNTGLMLRIAALVIVMNGVTWLGLAALFAWRGRREEVSQGAILPGPWAEPLPRHDSSWIGRTFQRSTALLARWSRSWKNHLGFAFMLSAMAVVLGTGLFALRGIASLTAAQADQMRYQQALVDAEALRAESFAAESDTRAYVFSGNEDLLVSQQNEMGKALEKMRLLARGSAGNPQQRAAVEDLSTDLDRRFGSLRTIVSVRKQAGPAGVARSLATGNNLRLKHDLQESISHFEAVEYQFLVQGNLQTSRKAIISKALILFVAFPAALGLGLLGFITARLLARSTSLQRRLQGLNGTLSTLIDTAPVGIFSFVPGVNLGYWNPAAEKIFCLRSDDVTHVGLSAIDPKLGTFLQQVDARLGSAAEASAHKPLPLSWTTDAGEQVVLQVSAARVDSDREGPCEIVAIAQDVTETFHLQEQLVFQAHHDALTGLPNRSLLEQRMSHMLASARAANTHFAVFAIDLDRFKGVNDRFGHEAGDQFLIQVVKRLTSAVRKSDPLFRIGGDEFLLLIEHLQNEEDAALIAKQLLACIEQPLALAETMLRASISVGIAVYPDDGSTTEDLRRNADAALYKAKTEGRHQYRRFVLDPGERRNQALRECLDTALEEGRFRLVFQPQYSTTGGLRGFETLLRLRHPSLGAISPAEFIPLAEGSGLILKIGSWVLEQACAVQAAWLGEGLHPGIMAVNVSAAQFACPDLADLVAETLRSTGLPPEHLELELTESMVMSNADEATRQMNRLERFGVRLAIDDFGIGYSSLSHLNRLPIGTLKIDRTFVQQLDVSNTSRPIVEAIVALGKTLSMKVVAEGVENENQRAILSGAGCDYLQGFLFARPLEQAQARALLMGVEPLGNGASVAAVDETFARTLIM